MNIQKTACWALLGVLVLATGCYSRANLRQKTTPPAAKILVQIEVDPGLVEARKDQTRDFLTDPQAQAVEQAEDTKANIDRQVAQSGQMMATMGASLEGQLRTDLIKRQLGFPSEVAEDVDLKLIGTLRADPYSGAVLDWQLVEVRSNAVVMAGVATSTFMNTDEYVDQVLGDLLAIDIDKYAKGGSTTPTAPTAPTTVGIDAPPDSATDGSGAFAVIIGIENYRDELPPATHAETDAKAFAAFAETTLGVPPAHIKTLLGQRAGRADIASAIEEWLPRNVKGPGATVYVFFSGHGAPDVETGDAYLVPYDADPAFLKTRGYAIGALYDTLGALPADRVMVFVDACFSGRGDRSVLAKGTRPLVPVKPPTASKKGVVALSASAANETTGATDKAPHGLFTFHLLTGLAGAADSNRDTNVTLSELTAHVSAEVTREARLQNRDQTPTLLAPRGTDAETLVIVKSLSP